MMTRLRVDDSKQKKLVWWQLVSARRLHDSGSGSAAREASHITMACR